MDPRIDQLRDHLRTTRAALDEALDHISSDRWQDAPPERWSVARIALHVATVETSVTGLLRAVLPTVPAREDEATVSSSFVEDLGLGYILDRSRRIQTIPAAVPRPDASQDHSRAALAASRGEFLSVLEQAEGKLLESVRHAHPALGELDLYQWIAFVAYHEARHTDQIHELAAALDGQAPEPTT